MVLNKYLANIETNGLGKINSESILFKHQIVLKNISKNISAAFVSTMLKYLNLNFFLVLFLKQRYI